MRSVRLRPVLKQHKVMLPFRVDVNDAQLDLLDDTFVTAYLLFWTGRNWVVIEVIAQGKWKDDVKPDLEYVECPARGRYKIQLEARMDISISSPNPLFRSAIYESVEISV